MVKAQVEVAVVQRDVGVVLGILLGADAEAGDPERGPDELRRIGIDAQ